MYFSQETNAWSWKLEIVGTNREDSLQVTDDLLVLNKGITNNAINPNLKAIVQNWSLSIKGKNNI